MRSGVTLGAQICPAVSVCPVPTAAQAWSTRAGSRVPAASHEPRQVSVRLPFRRAEEGGTGTYWENIPVIIWAQRPF